MSNAEFVRDENGVLLEVRLKKRRMLIQSQDRFKDRDRKRFLELVDEEPKEHVCRPIPVPKFPSYAIRTTEEEATSVWSYWIKPQGTHLLICNLGKPTYIEAKENMVKSAVASRIFIDFKHVVGNDVRAENSSFLFWNMMLLDPAFRLTTADVKQSQRLNVKKLENLTLVNAKTDLDTEETVFLYVSKFSDVVCGVIEGKWVIRQEDVFAYVNSV